MLFLFSGKPDKKVFEKRNVFFFGCLVKDIEIFLLPECNAEMSRIHFRFLRNEIGIQMANNLIAKKFQSNAIAITSSKSAADKLNEKVIG